MDIVQHSTEDVRMRKAVWVKFNAVAPETQGYALGLLGVAGFSATLPATRIAVTYLDPTLVGLGRSLFAAVFALFLLRLLRQPLPARRQLKSLFIVAAGVVVGFPWLSSLALRDVPSAHAGIIVAVVPLLTAMAGALRTGERPSTGFWLASVCGSALVVVFALRGGAAGLDGAHVTLLLLASLAVAVGYAEGARLAKEMGGWQVICWALLIAAPFTVLPVGFALYRHGVAAPFTAWVGFAYVSVISQLIAFFLWYQGLAMGGVVRVSQVQLLQPFMTLLVAMLLLGEHVTATMLGFALAVVSTVAIGRKMPIRKPVY
jgi:drug/metabolite transporter (DMT)-like permease